MDDMSDSDLILHETARMDIYKGLSTCYYFPDRRLNAQLDVLVNQLAFMGSNALSCAVMMRSDLGPDDNLEPLKVEFARLFVGPYRLAAPPYGSIYLEGKQRIMGDSTVDVRNRYLDSGLAIAETFKDAPDHIAAELEYMYYLVTNEIEAIHSEKLDESFESLQKQKSFLTDHLGAWIVDFSRTAERSTNQEFYRNLAKATKIFVTEDLDYLASLNVYQTN